MDELRVRHLDAPPKPPGRLRPARAPRCRLGRGIRPDVTVTDRGRARPAAIAIEHAAPPPSEGGADGG